MEMRLIKHKYGLDFGCAACLMPIHAEASPVAREDDLPRGPQQAVRTGSKFQVVCGSSSRELVHVSRAGVLENSGWAAASTSTVSAMLGTGLVRVVVSIPNRAGKKHWRRDVLSDRHGLPTTLHYRPIDKRHASQRSNATISDILWPKRAD
jgi:hypothetical protein